MLFRAAKLVIISNNTPPIKKSEIEYYAMLSKTGVHHYTGSERLEHTLSHASPFLSFCEPFTLPLASHLAGHRIVSGIPTESDQKVDWCHPRPLSIVAEAYLRILTTASCKDCPSSQGGCTG